nr:MAG TPA: hypothetical protein [Caudoviricetes sp.]
MIQKSSSGRSRRESMTNPLVITKQMLYWKKKGMPV